MNCFFQVVMGGFVGCGLRFYRFLDYLCADNQNINIKNNMPME